MKKEYLLGFVFILAVFGWAGYSYYKNHAAVNAVADMEKAREERNMAFLSTCPLRPDMCECTVWYAENYVPEEQRAHILSQISKMLNMPQDELMPYLDEFFGSGAWDAQIINALSEYCAAAGAEEEA